MPEAPTSAETESGQQPVPKPGCLKKLLFLVILIGGGFLVLCVITEIVLRMAGYGDLEVYDPDPRVFWRLRAGQDSYTKINRKPVHVNSLGTRGAEVSPEKPVNTFRILMLGDSKTFGWGLADDETYAAAVERNLRALNGHGRQIEVINAGVNAWSYQQMRTFLEEVAIHWRPDVVVIGDGNLWTQFSSENDPAFVRKMMRSVRIKNLLRRSATWHYLGEVKLQSVYSRYREKFIPIDPKQDELFKEAQRSNPNAMFENAISEMCAISKRFNATPVLLYMPLEESFERRAMGNSNALREIGELKRRIAREENVLLCDAQAAMWSQSNVYLPDDPAHPNMLGAAVIASQLTIVIAPLIQP